MYDKIIAHIGNSGTALANQMFSLGRQNGKSLTVCLSLEMNEAALTELIRKDIMELHKVKSLDYVTQEKLVKIYDNRTRETRATVNKKKPKLPFYLKGRRF